MKSEPIDFIFLKELSIEPVTRSNWNKLVQLFGERGACGNCWCMYFRLKKADFQEGKINDINKHALKEIIFDDRPVGLMAIYDGQPIAWCAFAPREDFIKLENSRVHKRIDDKPVWSIPCLFIDKHFRRQGVSVELLKGVIRYAKTKGISIIEAYPTIPTTDTIPDSFAWIGLYKSFERAGFKIVDTTSKHRPMVRYYTGK
jgi:GNAT superfamily N-acetyltransferase